MKEKHEKYKKLSIQNNILTKKNISCVSVLYIHDGAKKR